MPPWDKYAAPTPAADETQASPDVAQAPQPAAQPAGPWAKYAAPQQQAAAPAKSGLADTMSGVNRGLLEGFGNLIGMPGDFVHAIDKGSMAAVTYGAQSVGLISPEMGDKIRKESGIVPDEMRSEAINRHLRQVANAAGVVTDQPTTTAGQYGETIGSFLPTAVTMGEASLPGMLKSATKYGVVPGAASEAAGQATQGTPIEPYARAAAAIATGGVGGGASEVRPAAIQARQAGYVLPPSSISERPGMVSSALAGWSGKIKTQQAASEANQAVTNSLAAKALKLPEETTLTPEVFQQVRQNEGKAYQEVIDAVPTVRADQDFRDAVGDLGGNNSQAAQAFPKITNNPGIKDMINELMGADEHPTGAWVELVKELRSQGNANLKAIGDPSKHALGLAQRQAADAVDDLVERNILGAAAQMPGAASGATNNVVAQYKQARQQIAKSYDVEGATNPATGDVNARGLARLAAKGRPLSDELKTISDAATAFPKATMAPAGFGNSEKWSGLDFFGAMASMAHGNPGVAAAILGRPMARAAILSKPAQNMMTRQSPPPVPRVIRLPVLGREGALSTRGDQDEIPSMTIRPNGTP